MSEAQDVQTLAEEVKKFPSYEAAAKAACAWVEQGKVKVDRTKLRIYPSKAGPVKGRIVGVALLRDSGILEDIVRIDNDDTGKGIHWNAKNLSDTSKKFAGCEERTIKMKENERLSLFYDYLKALENLSVETIWDWWRTGKKPTHVAEVDAGVEAEAQE